mgnify:CR=1 FL=1
MRMLKKFGNLLRARRKCDLRAKTIKNIAIFGYANLAENDELFKGEAAYLIFHLLVLFEDRGIGLEEVVALLQKRHQK